MIYKESLPHYALRSYIRCYYYCHDQSLNGGSDNAFRFPSDGGAELIFTLKNYFKLGFSDDKFELMSGPKLLGPCDRAIFTNSKKENITFAVRFYPGRMAPFFSFPASELKEGIFNLTDVWGKEVKELEEQINLAVTFEEMVMAMNSILLKLLSKKYIVNKKVDAALLLISNSGGQLQVEDIAEKVNISRRQLERLFSPFVGITPKRLCRIERFRTVLSYLYNFSNYRWSDIAAQFGYSDQAHMIHEFNFFTGTSPEVCLKNLRSFDQIILSN